MTAHPIRIAHSLETLGSALIVLVLSVAGFSDAQAAPIIIDTFVDNQFAPPDSTIDAPGAIGGTRTLSADGQVIGAIGDGVWVSADSIPPGGEVEVIYDAGGDGLELDLTDGGVNTRFEVDMTFLVTTGQRFQLFVTDSDGNQGSFDEFWLDLDDFGISCIPLNCSNGFGFGTLVIPFAALTGGGADLTSIDSIRVKNILGSFGTTVNAMNITEIRTVVPEPGTALLLGLGLTGLGVVGRPRR